MKRNYVIISLVMLVMVASGCKFLTELSSFSKCEFRMKSIKNTQLAGVDVQNIKSVSDLNFATMAKLTTTLSQGKMPVNFTLNIEAKNPNPTDAAINKIQWIALIDDKQAAEGVVNKRIEIPANNGTAVIPLDVSTDLTEVFSKDMGKKLIDIALGLAGANDEPSRVTLKVKPTILVGPVEFDYPGYFNLSKEFKAE